MNSTEVSSKRSLTSYSKVQSAISMVTRSHAIFVNKDRIRDLKLLNIGCGPNIYPQFINLDYSWQPGINICWDITKKPYPLSNDSLDGIFTEHCLEHISVPACQKNLEEFHRLLKPGGTLRIVVPDAEIYYTIYNKRLNGEKIAMPYEESYISPNARINGLFRNHGHQFIYDFETFRIMLQKAGFKDIKKEKYREGRNPALLVDTDWRAVESLYVEASK